MNTIILQGLAIAAVAAFLVAVGMILGRKAGGRSTILWIAPAGLACLLLIWSLYAVLAEGPLGFWTQHTKDAWGVQIWCDLLLSIGAAFTLLAPAARAVGMRPTPWLVLTCCTGSVGLLAMLARYLFLRERTAAPARIAHRLP